ncbi:MAG TPA: hypothetical protein VNB52_06855 [Ilumatobacteraceae bacterium]|nr:hypothetical protein [Ilumatobacteraceae bacterium]
MLTALAVSITFGLAACGASDANGGPTSPVTVAVATTTAATQPATSVPAVPITTAPVSPDDSVATTDGEETLSDAEVADMEKQLDEIDQLLAGVDSDLSHD